MTCEGNIPAPHLRTIRANNGNRPASGGLLGLPAPRRRRISPVLGACRLDGEAGEKTIDAARQNWSAAEWWKTARFSRSFQAGAERSGEPEQALNHELPAKSRERRDCSCMQGPAAPKLHSARSPGADSPPRSEGAESVPQAAVVRGSEVGSRSLSMHLLRLAVGPNLAWPAVVIAAVGASVPAIADVGKPAASKSPTSTVSPPRTTSDDPNANPRAYAAADSRLSSTANTANKGTVRAATASLALTPLGGVRNLSLAGFVPPENSLAYELGGLAGGGAVERLQPAAGARGGDVADLFRLSVPLQGTTALPTSNSAVGETLPSIASFIGPRNMLAIESYATPRIVNQLGSIRPQ